MLSIYYTLIVIHSFLLSVSVSDPSLLGKFTLLVDIRTSTKGRGI